MRNQWLAVASIAVAVATTSCTQTDEERLNAVVAAAATSTTTTPLFTPASPDADLAQSSPLECTPAPVGTTSIGTAVSWADGMERQLQLQLGRADSTRPSADALSLTPVELRVSGSEGNWTFLWEAATPSFDEVGISSTMLARLGPALDALPHQRIEYRVDRDPYRIDVLNAPELRDNALRTIEILSAVFPNEESRTAAEQLYNGASDDGIAALFFNEPLLFHALEDGFFSVGDPVVFDDVMPNSLGGDPFPALTSIGVAELIDDEGCVAVEITTVPDPELLFPILFQTVEAAFGDVDAQSDADIAMMAESFSIETRVTGQFDYGTGRFRRITSVTEIASGRDTRIDTTIITDVSPP
ncbi:MAG: hypothetical protein AAGC53_22620 [Actinomycetota bacterium]